LRKGLIVFLLLLVLASFAEAPRRPITGVGVGLFGGYWIHSGPSLFYDYGYSGSLRVGYRFRGGELELNAFCEFTSLSMKEIWDYWREGVTGSVVVGITSRISFSPTSWISPYFSAGPAFHARSSSLRLERTSRDYFTYSWDAYNFAASIELGVEFPIQPVTIIELGCRYTHAFTPELEKFAGVTFGAGVSIFF